MPAPGIPRNWPLEDANLSGKLYKALTQSCACHRKIMMGELQDTYFESYLEGVMCVQYLNRMCLRKLEAQSSIAQA